MAAITFDTHNFIKKLTAAGMPETQAEVLAKEQVQLLEDKLVTKHDLKLALAKLKSELIKWMISMMSIQFAFIALLKLFH